MVKHEIISRPDKLFEFAGDKQALDLLIELGLVDGFSRSHPPGKRTGQMMSGDLPTHYVIATCLAGDLEAEDNGYWVLCIPKSEYSVEEIAEHMQAIVDRFQSRGIAIETLRPMFPPSPDNPNRAVTRV